MGEVSGAAAIDGVRVAPLTQIRDGRGAVLHMLRADSPTFEGFGEVYFSQVKPGVVKAWKRHRRMVQNLAVPVGAIRLVIYDDRPESATCGRVQEIVAGADDYCLVRIPPMVWYGFRGLADGDSLIANCATLPHDPAEVDRLPEDSPAIPYRW